MKIFKNLKLFVIKDMSHSFKLRTQKEIDADTDPQYNVISAIFETIIFIAIIIIFFII